jgi:hypothetical protein
MIGFRNIPLPDQRNLATFVDTGNDHGGREQIPKRDAAFCTEWNLPLVSDFFLYQQLPTIRAIAESHSKFSCVKV